MVTTEKAAPSAAPAKAATAAPAKLAAPAKAATAKKVAPKPTPKRVVKKAAPRAKAPVKTVAKVAVKAVPAKKAVTKPVLVKTMAAAAIAKPVVKAGTKPKVAKPVKDKKPKLVRDSFTIPKAEYSVLGELKQRAGKLGSAVKKSELLRAGIKALAAMADTAFVAALKAVPAVKTGRPAKD
jgi:hypothetical protein